MPALLALCFATPLYAAEDDASLLLEVKINGFPTGKIGEFILRKGDLLSRSEEIRDLGLRLPIGSVATADLLSFSALPNVTWRVEESTQMLYITARPESLEINIVKVDQRSESDRNVETGTGLTLNYDVVDTAVGMQNGVSGSLDVRAFSPRGVFNSGTLVYHGQGDAHGDQKHLIRLDTAMIFVAPSSLTRFTLGDFITGSLSWTRPVRLEGFQVRSDFTMRPDLITFPLPTLSGVTAVPSTVDVLANGNTVLSSQVNPGPFEIPALPVVSGAGNISITTTDPLGHSITVSRPFYASAALLKPGLQAFSIQAGAVRLNWGAASNDYGAFAGSAIYRRGLTNRLTIEGNVEGTSKFASGGGGVVVNLHDQGIVNLALAASEAAGNVGAQYSAGLQRLGASYSFSAAFTAADARFRDTAALSGQPLPRRQISGNAGYTTRHVGSFGVALAVLDQAPGVNLPSTTGFVEHPRVLSATYSLQVHRLSLVTSLLRNFASSSSNGVTVGLTLPFGRVGSATASFGSESSLTQLQVRQSAVSVGEWGYEGFVSGGEAPHEFAKVEHKSRTSLLSIGLDRSGEQTSLISEAQGAFSLIDGSVFASNTVNDSFAVVDTEGLPDVHVFAENRPVGRTDRSGRLLVPDLRSFDNNRLEINLLDIPLDAAVNSVVQHVRPLDHAGVVLKFKVRSARSALLQMIDESGSPLPVGSTATLRQTGVVVPVGFDGQAFFQDLSGTDDIDVILAGGGRCSLKLEYKPVSGQIPTIGPKLCRSGN